jgi:hypothetical protein
MNSYSVHHLARELSQKYVQMSKKRINYDK